MGVVFRYLHNRWALPTLPAAGPDTDPKNRSDVSQSVREGTWADIEAKLTTHEMDRPDDGEWALNGRGVAVLL